MKRAAFLACLGVFKISLRSILSLLPSSLSQISLLRSLNLVHARRTCRTVWLPALQSHLASVISGTCLRKRNCRRPILSVRIWIMAELRALCSEVCTRRMACVGVGVSMCEGRPLVSVFHSWAHCLWICRFLAPFSRLILSSLGGLVLLLWFQCFFPLVFPFCPGSASIRLLLLPTSLLVRCL